MEAGFFEGRPGGGAFLMRSIASRGYRASRVSISTPALRNRFSAAHLSMPKASAISVNVKPFIDHLSVNRMVNFRRIGNLLKGCIVEHPKNKLISENTEI